MALGLVGDLCVIQVDINRDGSKFIDTFVWDVTSPMLPDEFSIRTCCDLELPSGFALEMTQQIKIQLYAFNSLRSFAVLNPNAIIEAVDEDLETIRVGLRYGCVTYNDNFSWDMLSLTMTPEEFAIRTVNDLGLPVELTPALAVHTRDTLLRALLNREDVPLVSPYVVAEEKHDVVTTSLESVSLSAAEDVVGAVDKTVALANLASLTAVHSHKELCTPSASNCDLWA